MDDDRGRGLRRGEVNRRNMTVATQFEADVCNQFRDDTCGHCWACAMRRGFIDVFRHPDQCVNPELVYQLLDVIHAIREVDEALEKHRDEQEAFVTAAEALTNLVVDLHDTVRGE